MKVYKAAINIPTKNRQPSVEWYRKVFQPEQLVDSAKNVTKLFVGGLWIRLVDAEPGGCIRLRFEVEHLETELQRLRQLGISDQLTIRVEDEIFKYIELTDPNGNGIRLYQMYNES